MSKIRVDKKKCIGCGLCASIAPEVFKTEKNGKSQVIKNPPKLDDKVKSAIESCPAQAISARD